MVEATAPTLQNTDFAPYTTASQDLAIALATITAPAPHNATANNNSRANHNSHKQANADDTHTDAIHPNTGKTTITTPDSHLLPGKNNLVSKPTTIDAKSKNNEKIYFCQKLTWLHNMRKPEFAPHNLFLYHHTNVVNSRIFQNNIFSIHGLHHSSKNICNCK